jgi:hypothetical protein
MSKGDLLMVSMDVIGLFCSVFMWLAYCSKELAISISTDKNKQSMIVSATESEESNIDDAESNLHLTSDVVIMSSELSKRMVLIFGSISLFAQLVAIISYYSV